MRDEDCVRFLSWALPRLRMRWAGFRKVRRQVCRRLARRMVEIGCEDVDAYRAELARNAEEWKRLDELCRVTISRFYRDRHGFDALRKIVLPELARGARARGASALRIWCCGCASGEEPFTISLLWKLDLEPRFADLSLAIVATDVDPALLERARRASYPESSLRDLPEAWKRAAFSPAGEELVLDARFRATVELHLQDVREELPEGPFDLVSCRNLVFTYFEPSLQHEILESIVEKIVPGGALFVGAHESPPNGLLAPWVARSGIYRKRSLRGSS